MYLIKCVCSCVVRMWELIPKIALEYPASGCGFLSANATALEEREVTSADKKPCLVAGTSRLLTK